ncbi:hypothetical protein ACH4SP_27365 [Streptomyces sp. NPDC021093]|uniref:hypothetical protein n=1 Tax=Streptomyces sp. NPDC021093 TaxID=3365112 RepID=UPI00379205BF
MTDLHTAREPRGGLANLGMFLVVMLFNTLPAGYAWLVVAFGGWADNDNGREPSVPVWELAVSGGVLVAVALTLALGRFWGAAAAQLAFTAILMAWLLSSYR